MDRVDELIWEAGIKAAELQAQGLKLIEAQEGDDAPVDVHDQEAAMYGAIELAFPLFNAKTAAVIEYFDDTAFMYWYKGQFVITDESLYLTAAGDGKETPMGFPRWEGETVEAMKEWLEDVYNDLVDMEDIQPVA